MEIELKTFAVDHLSPSKEIIQDPIYLESLVFDYLSYAGIGSNDVELFEHNNVSFLSLTKDACTKLEVIQKHNRSSITIQRFWRGFQTRKSIDLPESTKEKNNKRDLLVLSDAYTHLINLVKDPHIVYLMIDSFLTL